MELRDTHKLVVEWETDLDGNGEWFVYVSPILGKEIFFNVDSDYGVYEFTVSCVSGYWNDRKYIERWLSESCDQFVFQGKTYSDIHALSVAMWAFEAWLEYDCDAANDDLVECIGPLMDEVQEELFRMERRA